MQVVMPVLGSPPENALLRACLCEEPQQELKDPARAVGSVRKVPVIAGANRKHSRPVKDKTYRYGLPADAAPKHLQTGEMDQYKRQRGRIYNVIVRVAAHAAIVSF